MAGLAKGAKVIFSMGAAAIYREYMVNLIGGDEAVEFETFFAERVLG